MMRWGRARGTRVRNGYGYDADEKLSSTYCMNTLVGVT